MARTKQETPRWKLPKTLPEGVVIETASRTLGKKPEGWTDESPNTDEYGKNVPVKVLSVKNNAGIVFVQEQLNKALGDGAGEEFLVNAVNSALIGVVTDLTPATAGESLTIAPTASAPRYVDPLESVMEQVRAMREAGKTPDEATLRAMLAEVL